MTTNGQTPVRKQKQHVEVREEWGGIPNPHEVVDITQTTAWPKLPEGENVSPGMAQLLAQSEASMKVAWQTYRMVSGVKIDEGKNGSVQTDRQNGNDEHGEHDEDDEDDGDDDGDDDDQESDDEDDGSQSQDGDGDAHMTMPDTDRAE